MTLDFDCYTMRLLCMDDLDNYYQLVVRNRKRLETFFAGTVVMTTTLEATQRYLREMLDKAEHKICYPFVVVDKRTGAMVAALQVKNIDLCIPKGELGYYIDEKYEGRGIVTRAVAAINRFCFGTLGFNKLYIRTHESNMPSRRVAEKNGFMPEGVIRRDYKNTQGQLLDVIYYGLLRDDWKRIK